MVGMGKPIGWSRCLFLVSLIFANKTFILTTIPSVLPLIRPASFLAAILAIIWTRKRAYLSEGKHDSCKNNCYRFHSIYFL